MRIGIVQDEPRILLNHYRELCFEKRLKFVPTVFDGVGSGLNADSLALQVHRGRQQAIYGHCFLSQHSKSLSMSSGSRNGAKDDGRCNDEAKHLSVHGPFILGHGVRGTENGNPGTAGLLLAAGSQLESRSLIGAKARCWYEGKTAGPFRQTKEWEFANGRQA